MGKIIKIDKPYARKKIGEIVDDKIAQK